MKDTLTKRKEILTPDGLRLCDLYTDGKIDLIVVRRNGKFSTFPVSYLIGLLTASDQSTKKDNQN